MEENIINFKATVNGLILIMREEDDFDTVYEHISRKLESSGRFFKGASLSVKYRGRKLNAEQEKMVSELISKKTNAEIKSFEEDTSAPEPVVEETEKAVEKPKMKRVFFRDLEEGITKFYKGTVRSGKLISFEGNLVVIGDVNPGGEVVATGNVIVITSGKGGVGKTTTTANLGTGLALAGCKVVLVDTDIGLRNLDVVMGLENRIVYDLVDVVEGFCRVKQALIKDKRYEGLYLLPAAQTRDKTAVNPQQMMKLCQELKEEFDYILIDCPAGIEQGFKNAIAGADRAIVVTTPEVSAVRDADRIIGLLEANELRNPKLLINRLRVDMVKRGDMMSIDDIIDILAIGLIGVVPDDEKIVVSTNRGEPAITDDKALAGQAYRNIVRRIRGEEVPFMTFNEDQGFVDKLKKLFGLKAN